jgi:hypothetical protein
MGYLSLLRFFSQASVIGRKEIALISKKKEKEKGKTQQFKTILVFELGSRGAKVRFMCTSTL